MINILKILLIFIFYFSTAKAANEDDIYKKIDLFSEVLDKINKESKYLKIVEKYSNGDDLTTEEKEILKNFKK